MKVGIEIPGELQQRLKIEAARRNVRMKDVWREAAERWLAAPDHGSDLEFQEQMRLAREGMARYRRALRELAR